MMWRTTSVACGLVSMVAGCTSAPVQHAEPVQQVQQVQQVQVQRQYDYTLAAGLHQLRVDAAVEFDAGLCSGFGRFEGRLGSDIVHSQDVFVAYPATDRCPAAMPQRMLQLITDSVGSDAQQLKTVARRIIDGDDCLRTGGPRSPESDLLCDDIVQIDVTKNDDGHYLSTTLFTDARMRQCVFDLSDTVTVPECKFHVIE